MASTCNEAAAELLRQSIAGEPWDAGLVDLLTKEECSDPLFRVVVEGMADRFLPKLCDDYASMFSLILEQAVPEFRAADLCARYDRVRRVRRCEIEPARVIVLSRVTLGADIAVTSVILEAVKERFPQAEIMLAGSVKAAELFARDERIGYLNAPYPRNGGLSGRLNAWRELRRSTALDDTIVVDPDSRLTQLGLLPVCDESRYFFFESRAFGGDSEASLGELARMWSEQTFGVDAGWPWLAPVQQPFVAQRPCAAVSLGVGGNNQKRLDARFERELVRMLGDRFASVIVDCGFGAEEAERVQQAIAGTTARAFSGSFADFASLIGQSDLYVGYDSAGQHAAAAFGTPLLTVFRGFASDRMFARWRPTGPGPKEVLKVYDTVEMDEVAAALDRLRRA